MIGLFSFETIRLITNIEFQFSEYLLFWYATYDCVVILMLETIPVHFKFAFFRNIFTLTIYYQITIFSPMLNHTNG